MAVERNIRTNMEGTDGSDSNIRFLRLRDESNTEQYISNVVPCLYDSGSHHFDTLFGGRELACKRLVVWVRRPSSVFAIRRATVAFDREMYVGAILDLCGRDLTTCHKSDTLAWIKETRGEDRSSLLGRLASLRDMTPVVLPTEYYLRSLAVSPSYRGRGLGRKLLERYIQNGLDDGFKCFRLDVLADNTAAVNLYSSFGFVKINEVIVPQTGAKIFSMSFERHT